MERDEDMETFIDLVETNERFRAEHGLSKPSEAARTVVESGDFTEAAKLFGTFIAVRGMWEQGKKRWEKGK